LVRVQNEAAGAEQPSTTVRLLSSGVLNLCLLNLAASIYATLSGNFFFDLQPPLGKLLYTFIARELGYNATSKPGNVGSSYPSDYPFEALRTVSAVGGALMAPFAFLALRSLGFSRAAATVAGSFIAFGEL
jgi:dolichyl-phosphate-mannose-protein mannosyltransferase